MAEWLGDTPIFQETMTDEERTEFAFFKTKVKAIDTKETDMAKKNDAQTTINENVNTTESKEDTTMTIKGIPTGTRKNGNIFYDRNTDIARHHVIRDEFKAGRIKGIEVTTCIPGESWENFTNDPKEVELLGKVCKKLGWTDGVCTVAKAMKFHGMPNPEYTGHGWLVKYLPRTPKSGKNAGMTIVNETIVYPMEAFVWDTESGLPEFDEEKAAVTAARRARTAARNADKKAKEAEKAAGIKPKRKARRVTAKKVDTIKDEPVAAAPSADIAAMAATVNALMEQNAQLIAALTAALNN